MTLSRYSLTLSVILVVSVGGAVGCDVSSNSTTPGGTSFDVGGGNTTFPPLTGDVFVSTTPDAGPTAQPDVPPVLTPDIPTVFTPDAGLPDAGPVITPPGPDTTTQPPGTLMGVGQPCEQDAECVGDANALCIPALLPDGTAGWPAGYCTIAQCDQVGCPDGSACFGDGSGEFFLCLTECDTRGDCRSDYTCAGGACQPACLPSDCQDGQVCNATSGLCEDPTGPGDCGTTGCPAGQLCDASTGQCVPDGTTGPNAGAVGAACLGDTDCAAGICIPATFPDGAEGWPGGYCTALDCGTTACPGGSTCFGDEEFNFCLDDCVQHTDCRDAYACIGGACQPKCSPGDCPDGFYCDADGSCQEGVAPTSCVDTGCNSGFTCNAASGECVPDGPVVTPADGSPGSPCVADAECDGANGFCIPALYDDGTEGWPNGYCSAFDCDSVDCPAGSECYVTPDETFYFCLQTCGSTGDCYDGYACMGGACQPKCSPGDCPDGFTCNAAGECVEGGPVDPPTGDGAVGAACVADEDCLGATPMCIPAVYSDGSTGWPGGYCATLECDTVGCAAGATCFTNPDESLFFCLDNCNASSECRAGYVCDGGACSPDCQASGCPAGQTCGADGFCSDAPCTPGSCPAGLVCGDLGACIPDLSGDPGAGPGPSCGASLPTRDCSGSEAYCGALLPFEPVDGPGYTNYPLNGESAANQYRSYARRDLQMLVKYAAAFADCKASDWAGGNGFPLGLGDMSEADGAIPGTSIGEQGHPDGTHVDGNDMDIAYFQVGTPNNQLRPVCEHSVNGLEQYHCVQQPHLLDIWRTSLFIGALMSSSRVRVIGVDGKVGELVLETLDWLCGNGWFAQSICDNATSRLAFEVTNTNMGWFLHHHHHLHVSLKAVAPGAAAPVTIDGQQCLAPQCDVDYQTPTHNVPGHSYIGDPEQTPGYNGLPLP